MKKEVTFEDELSDRTRIKKQMEKQLLTRATKRHDEDYNEYQLSQKYNKNQFEVEF